MQRFSIDPRPNWQQIVEGVGLTYHSTPSGAYWKESAYYEFMPGEVDQIEMATNELQAMCIAAAQHVIDKNLFPLFAIPEWVIPLIKEAWNAEPPAIYGRMDLAFDGMKVKLLEYNADTPTALLEASVVQWHWRTELFGDRHDQFNSIEEKLIAKWTELHRYLAGSPLYFAHVAGIDEDFMTVTYLRELAEKAGITTEAIRISDIGWNAGKQEFTDVKEQPIRSIFKLYPWEWLVNEPFGRHIPQDCWKVQWIEPIWKMLLSNKAILAVLWELYPDHPLLLPAFLDGPRNMTSYVKKPILSREGANVTVVEKGAQVLETSGDYGEDGYVYQKKADLACMDGQYAVIGSWIVDGVSCGMGIREASKLVTDNTSSFVPHIMSSPYVK